MTLPAVQLRVFVSRALDVISPYFVLRRPILRHRGRSTGGEGGRDIITTIYFISSSTADNIPPSTRLRPHILRRQGLSSQGWGRPTPVNLCAPVPGARNILFLHFAVFTIFLGNCQTLVGHDVCTTVAFRRRWGRSRMRQTCPLNSSIKYILGIQCIVILRTFRIQCIVILRTSLFVKPFWPKRWLKSSM